VAHARSQHRAAALERYRPVRAQLRRALWSSYFYRFFGGQHTGFVPSPFVPMSLDRALDTLQTAANGQTPEADRPSRDLVRRCVSQILLCGHQPDSRFGPMLVDSTKGIDRCTRDAKPSAPAVRAGAAGVSDEECARAIKILIGWGEQEFDVPGALQRRATSPEEELRDASPTQVAQTLPTQVVHRGDAFTVEKHGYFRRDLAGVSRLVNPVNWTKLGEFFERTDREHPTHGPKSDRKEWHGVLGEDFVVSWNGFNSYLFEQKLKIDFSVSRDLVRTDYSLMYEEDDQIVLNEGFFDARTMPGSQGWIHVTMSKTVRFSSSILNLLAPAILAMFLDSKIGGFKQLIETEVGSAR
jgi:hypothetical protein